MSKRILSIASSVLIAVLVFSTVFASGIKLSGVTFSLGSLISNGGVTGLGNTDVTLVLDASGIPAITCVNNGTNQAPGQSYPKVSAQGSTMLNPNTALTKNGSTPYSVETGVPPTVTWQQAGCPNSNWTAKITFVFWTNATISIYDTLTGVLLLRQKYVCTTTTTSVNCTPMH
jgi:hypothetical protein